MKNIFKNTLLLTLIACIISACEDDVTVIRSNQLLILGPTEVYVGEFNVFGVNDFSGKLTYNWSVEGIQPSETAGTGRETEVSFDAPGVYTVTFTEGDRTGSMEVEAISKLISLSGESDLYTETNTIDTVGFQVFVENDFVSGEVTINYTIEGTAVEGVDYELLSENPLILDGDSEEEDYFIYVRFLNDNAIESPTKFVIATITSVTTEIEEEVILDEDEYLTAEIEIEDDFIAASIADTDDLDITEPTIVEVTIQLSGELSEDITVGYSISGIGVTDVSPTGPGSVTFAEGEVSKIVYLQFTNAAFVDDQVVTFTLNSINSVDEEIELDAVQKTFIINVD